ncbi:MAG: hypothetical protein ACRDKT_11785 [Actinomycetota bacterium]
MNLHRDESGVIVSWFVKVAIFLAVIGVVIFDVGSIVVNAFTLDSTADEIAIAVSLTVDQGPITSYTDQEVLELAREELASKEVEKVRVLRKGTTVDRTTGVVHIRLRRRANTLVTKYIGFLKPYTVATGNGQAGTN